MEHPIPYLYTSNAHRFDDENKKNVQFVGGHGELQNHDSLRQGLRCVRSEIVSGHPLEHTIAYEREFNQQKKYAMLRSTQGFHSVMRLEMDKAYLSQMKRLPVFGARNHALDTLMGRDEDIEFYDYLNTESVATKFMDVHASTEVALSMTKIGL